MITRTLAVYGIEYIKPTLVWIVTTIVVSLALVFTIYPIGIFLTTGLNPIPFVKKTLKVGLFAAATNSFGSTLPLNTKTCTEELGCSKEISSFCSSDRYDDQYERYDSDAYDRNHVYSNSGRNRY